MEKKLYALIKVYDYKNSYWIIVKKTMNVLLRDYIWVGRFKVAK